MTVKVTKPALNLREELSSLKKETGVAGEAMLRAATPQEQFTLIGAGRKNLIINGDFQVSQRGDYTTAASLTNGVYTLDRWTCSNGVGATIQHRQDMPSGEYGKSVKVLTSSGGTAQCAIEQRVEIADWMYSKEITATAWVRSNSSKASINIYNNTDSFWTAVSHSGNGTWEKLTITGTLPTSMSDFRVRIGLSQGGNTTIVAGDYFEIANVQLELGSVATPFEHRSYGEELALCQRYYEEIIGNRFGGVANNNYIQSEIQCTVRKRTTPSITQSANVTTFTAFAVQDLTGQNSAFIPAGTSSDYGSIGYFAVSGATTGRYYSINSPCVFKFDAEL